MSPQNVSSEHEQVFSPDPVPSSRSLLRDIFCSHVQYYTTAVHITAAVSATLITTTGIKIHLEAYGEMRRLMQTSKTKHYYKCQQYINTIIVWK